MRAHGVKSNDRELVGGPRSETVLAVARSSQRSSPTWGHTDPLISAANGRDHRGAKHKGAARSGHTRPDETIIGVAEKVDVLRYDQHGIFSLVVYLVA